ncbi:MAG: hypothetical protein JSS51_10205 [Planctomycetes bacterium]|nr:hypothetical protein [Planctomycetota bacterium]
MDGLFLSAQGEVMLAADGSALVTSGDVCPECGCGGQLGPCCAAGRRCEWKFPTAQVPVTLKGWSNYTVSTRLGVNSICKGTVVSSDSAGGSQTYGPEVFAQGLGCELKTTAFLSWGWRSYNATGGVDQAASSLGASVQLVPNYLQGDFTDTMWLNRAIASQDKIGVLITATAGVETAPDARTTLGCAFRAFLWNGQVTAAIDSFGWSGSVTPTLLQEGLCTVGIRLDFDVSTQVTCRASGDFGGPVITSTARMYGSVAFAVCGLLTGCANAGSVCASVDVPQSAGSDPLPAVDPDEDPIDAGGKLLVG